MNYLPNNIYTTSNTKKARGFEFDTITAFLYLACVLWGIINIYAAIYQPDSNISFFNLGLNSTKQIIWLGVATIAIIVILLINYHTFEAFAYIFYGLAIVALILVLFLGKEISGSRSWFDFGGVRIQPAEFAKIATILALSKFLSVNQGKLDKFIPMVITGAIIGFPAILILLQGDLGSAMVFGILILVAYREGLPHWIVGTIVVTVILFVLSLFSIFGGLPIMYLFIGIAVIALIALLAIYFYAQKAVLPIAMVILVSLMAAGIILGTRFFINDVLKEYQKERIAVLFIDMDDDKVRLRSGWNVAQSKIAIGSGGFWGKGFLSGTQTKFDFVPEQSTDFIFCTIGEEHGWFGSLITISLFLGIIFRAIMIAERQRDSFARVYGYGVACIIFFHFATNIAMTIGLFPVIGIPLPFFSYGGSSLIAFSILLFILLKMDAHRSQMMKR